MGPNVKKVRWSRWLLGQQGATMGLLILAVSLVEVVRHLIQLNACRGCVLPCTLLYYGLMAGFPFLLARAAPTCAGFDCQWLPLVWSHWLWFPGMVLLLLVVGGVHHWLWSLQGDWFTFSVLRGVMTDVAPVTVMLRGVGGILFAPIAEEFFWRAYVLPQLRKVTPWPIALSTHSLFFSLSHLAGHWSVLPAIFVYGTILGAWRLRFRSLLPLILAHMILNGVAAGPRLWAQYGAAVQSYSKCREIDLLTRETAEKAVPALIVHMADRNEVVSLHAIDVLMESYRCDAEPYLAEALASSDNYSVDRALSAIEWYRLSGLKPQVRSIVWSSGDLRIQLAGVLALRGIGDEEGLHDVLQKHPEERVRHAARDMLEGIQTDGRKGRKLELLY
jgi:membrane protease YdiL (CAAX protease family)